MATQVISRVREVFGVEIGVRSIFEEPTVAGLAQRIEEAIRIGEKDEALPLVSSSEQGAELAALVRAAAVVVLRSAGAEQSALQHPGRGEAGGEFEP